MTIAVSTIVCLILMVVCSCDIKYINRNLNNVADLLAKQGREGVKLVAGWLH